MEIRGRNVIGGRLVADGHETFQAMNPATGEVLAPEIHEAAEWEIAEATQLSAEAAAVYADRSPDDRAGFLERIADEIEALGDALIERADAETALGATRLLGERGRTANQLRLFAEVVREGSWVQARIDHAAPDREPLPKPDLRMMLQPIGPVAVFGASNFPLAFSVAGGDTASALAAGCPVVVKGHPAHPGTSELVARAVAKAADGAGMPEGVFSMLHGARPETGLALVRRPEIQAVGFTGSLMAGRAIRDAAAGRPKPIPVFAEMGSINPVFLLPQALKERADDIAGGLCQSVALGVGQFCTNPGLVIGLAGEEMSRLMDALARQIADVAPATALTKRIRECYEQGARAFESVDGVDLVSTASAAPDRARNQVAARLFSTSAEMFLSTPGLANELFGPSTLVVKCQDAADLKRVARSLDGQLTASFFTAGDDLEAHGALVSIMRDKVGRLVFNGYPTGVEVCPSMSHGGPYPATTDARSTSVGTAAIFRFARPICYQSAPQEALPIELRDANERGVMRLVDSEWTRE